MGIMAPKQPKSAAAGTKRSSTQLDFSNLAPLKPGGTVGFSSFRDNDALKRSKVRKRSNGDVGAMEEDSDEDEEDHPEVVGKLEDVEDKEAKSLLSPEDAKFQGELADGVGRIKVCCVSSTFPESLLTVKLSSSASILLILSTPTPVNHLGPLAHLLMVQPLQPIRIQALSPMRPCRTRPLVQQACQMMH